MLRQLLVTFAALALASCAQTAVSMPPNETLATATVHDELMERLTGRWVLRGVIDGQQTVHDVNAEWVLGRKYVRIEEVSRERAADGQPAYQATIYVGWLENERHYVCLWLDNTGVASGEITCAASKTPDMIAWEFRNAQNALIFTNSFSYDRASDAWQWRMVDPHGGQPETFGVVTLRRR